jgi:hypothetical protein
MQRTQKVCEFVKDGMAYIDHDAYFYNFVDQVNSQQPNRYGCIEPESITRIIQLDFDYWKSLTTRDEFKNMSFEQFDAFMKKPNVA